MTVLRLYHLGNSFKSHEKVPLLFFHISTHRLTNFSDAAHVLQTDWVQTFYQKQYVRTQKRVPRRAFFSKPSGPWGGLERTKIAVKRLKRANDTLICVPISIRDATLSVRTKRHFTIPLSGCRDTEPDLLSEVIARFWLPKVHLSLKRIFISDLSCEEGKY